MENDKRGGSEGVVGVRRGGVRGKIDAGDGREREMCR